MRKVMTLNINYYEEKHGSWSARRELILDQIRSTAPDLITLQAVKKDPNLFEGDDQATQLARMSGYPYTIYQPAVEYQDGSSAGSGILARYPLLEKDFIKLSLIPNTEDTNQRVLMSCLCNAPPLRLRIFNAHFSWVPEQASENIREAYRYIHSFPDPFLLLGDLNTPPASNLFDVFRDAGMIDVWEQLCPQENGFTFEADQPGMRIDYAWASPSLKIQLKSIQILDNELSTRSARLSDHMGLLVELSS